VKWIHESADQGNPDGQKYLAFMYFSGNGMTKDIAEAIRWFRKAADQGDVTAQSMLGSIYGSGAFGVPRNDAEAIKWYRKAAEQGDGLAKAFLAQLLASNGSAPIPGIDFGPPAQRANSDEQAMFAQIQVGSCNTAGSWDYTLPAPLNNAPHVAITVPVKTVQPQIFLDPAQTLRMLDYLRTAAIQYCKQRGATALAPWFTVQMGENGYGVPYPFIAYANGDKGRWTIWKNDQVDIIKRELAAQAAQQEAQRQAIAEQERVARIIKGNTDSFESAYGVQQWVSRNELIANPFVFKDKIVAVQNWFIQAVSENEAIFANYCGLACDPIFVTNVPVATLRNGEAVILAVKVLGMKKSPMTGVSVPDLQLVGMYHCKDSSSGCADFANFNREGALIR
jgi:hypothetical protein